MSRKLRDILSICIFYGSKIKMRYMEKSQYITYFFGEPRVSVVTAVEEKEAP